MTNRWSEPMNGWLEPMNGLQEILATMPMDDLTRQKMTNIYKQFEELQKHDLQNVVELHTLMTAYQLVINHRNPSYVYDPF